MKAEAKAPIAHAHPAEPRHSFTIHYTGERAMDLSPIWRRRAKGGDRCVVPVHGNEFLLASRTRKAVYKQSYEKKLPRLQSALQNINTKYLQMLEVGDKKRLCEGALNLSKDPREWDRAEVVLWLKAMSLVHGIDVLLDRFQMNGKALCLMNMDMFVVRVPLGGKLLFKDFQLRLHKALHNV